MFSGLSQGRATNELVFRNTPENQTRIETKLPTRKLENTVFNPLKNPIEEDHSPDGVNYPEETRIVLRRRSKQSKAFLSPLRYPGGKSRLAATLLGLFPSFQTYREPFLGGASVFLRSRAGLFGSSWELSDKDGRLVNFWLHVQQSPEFLIFEIDRIRSTFPDGRDLFEFVGTPTSDIRSDAARYFLRNRISFSGNQSTGGYSEQAFNDRLTENSIEKIRTASKLLEGVSLAQEDYSSAMLRPGKEVFMFLDPPYLAARDSRLYGKNGLLHSNFDHQRFAETLLNSEHRWLVTYDDSQEIRSFFEGHANIQIRKLSMSYSSSNLNGANSRIGHEVVITNFKEAR